MLNSEEYDFNMKLTKIHKSSKDIDWIDLSSYEEEYICKGSLLKIKNFSNDEPYVELIFFDPSDDETSLGLLILTGKKSGNIWVLLPKDAYYKDTRLLSTKWIMNNWDKWIAPGIDIEKVKFLYQLHLCD